ncbi:hypothetical protein K461DRAFT_2091 [Myriangium duriaei CBS 260.36]|uniref:Heat shock factor-binding protein 1 n=1 Tax=Myriangium duriaei CBS 260.36 TaxID=1168546 RepID=A0A9P4J9Q8_9PEZI|nr:hypothetical protein K461DRAFT_2091 [Myriangium duriaei CBS 260.36]
MSSGPSNSDDKASDAPAELTAVVEDLLNQLTTKFSTISSEMMSKMDDMSKRLDNLEAIIQQNAKQDDADESKTT